MDFNIVKQKSDTRMFLYLHVTVWHVPFLARSYTSVMNSNHMSNLKLNTPRHAGESSAGGFWQTRWGIDLSQNWLIDGNVIICRNQIQTSDWRSGGMSEVEVYSAGRSLRRSPDAGNVYADIVDPKIPSIHFWTAGEHNIFQSRLDEYKEEKQTRFGFFCSFTLFMLFSH